jgi:hypothetical protein
MPKKTKSEEEKLTNTNISNVIKLLEPENNKKAISKKEACQILGINYNTTRLKTIIEQFKEHQRFCAEQRAKLRGKPLSKEEKIFIIEEYLSGNSIDSITKSTYRGISLIKQVLNYYNVPLRIPGQTYFNPQLVPENAMRDRFTINEMVWSTRYTSLAKIYSEKLDPKHGYIYNLWLTDDKWRQYCWQPHYELASLEHLRELGVKV